jgi:hypothetical protein
MRLLERFSVVLLDMNGTFMLGHDRFGPEQDYFATYQELGGRDLDREQVTDHARDLAGHVSRLLGRTTGSAEER